MQSTTHYVKYGTSNRQKGKQRVHQCKPRANRACTSWNRDSLLFFLISESAHFQTEDA